LKITTFCFGLECIGILSIGVQYLLDGGITPAVTASVGFALCACITYTYARWLEVNE